MRTHEQIIIDSGGALAVAKLLTPDASALEVEKTRKRVSAWISGKSIPAPYWRALTDHGLATLEELADAAALRLTANDPAPVERAA